MKKKGLIISTVVMAVVLIASLTTATYAWFSATASVEVSNISIQTTATAGIEIAVATTDTSFTSGYVNGAVNYKTDGENATTDWWSSTEGFGPSLDFTSVNIGTMENAVSNQITSASAIKKYTKVGLGSETTKFVLDGSSKTNKVYYTVGATGMETVPTGSTLVSSTMYYSDPVNCSAGTFYTPIGYYLSQPIGYVESTANDEYLDIPMAIHATKDDLKAIVCKISLTDNSSGFYHPGMAAATRIELTANSKTYVWAPYSSVKYVAGTAFTVIPEEGAYAFVLGTGDIDSAEEDIISLNVKIWIEGTDSECNNNTTSSTNFSVNINFDYAKETSEITEGYVSVTCNNATAFATALEQYGTLYTDTACTTAANETYTNNKASDTQITAFYAKKLTIKSVAYTVTALTKTFA